MIGSGRVFVSITATTSLCDEPDWSYKLLAAKFALEKIGLTTLVVNVAGDADLLPHPIQEEAVRLENGD